MGALSNLATVGLNFALAQQAARQDSGDINRERDRQIRRDPGSRTRSNDGASRRRCAGVWPPSAPEPGPRASVAAARRKRCCAA